MPDPDPCQDEVDDVAAAQAAYGAAQASYDAFLVLLAALLVALDFLLGQIDAAAAVLDAAATALDAAIAALVDCRDRHPGSGGGGGERQTSKPKVQKLKVVRELRSAVRSALGKLKA